VIPFGSFGVAFESVGTWVAGGSVVESVGGTWVGEVAVAFEVHLGPFFGVLSIGFEGIVTSVGLVPVVGKTLTATMRSVCITLEGYFRDVHTDAIVREGVLGNRASLAVVCETRGGNVGVCSVASKVVLSTGGILSIALKCLTACVSVLAVAGERLCPPSGEVGVGGESQVGDV